MATYIENDVQNALTDIQNRGAITTTSDRYEVSRTTLRDRLNDAQFCQHIYEDKQRLSTVQEERLEYWILQQEALGYAPTHAQLRVIASGILKQNSDDKPLKKK